MKPGRIREFNWQMRVQGRAEQNKQCLHDENVSPVGLLKEASPTQAFKNFR
jgi:hypothetical protein